MKLSSGSSSSGFREWEEEALLLIMLYCGQRQGEIRKIFLGTSFLPGKATRSIRSKNSACFPVSVNWPCPPFDVSSIKTRWEGQMPSR